MIPTIGLIIASYTMTRFVDMLTSPAVGTCTKVCAFIGLVVTVLSVPGFFVGA